MGCKGGRCRTSRVSIRDRVRAAGYCSRFVLAPGRWQAACKPGSVPGRGRGTAIPLGRWSPSASRDLPGRPARERARGTPRGPPSSLLGLAPGGVCRAAAVADDAVRPYRTVSPLPAVPGTQAGGLVSVALSLGSPPPGVTRHRVPVEPGLSSPARGRERPPGRLSRPSASGAEPA